MKLDTPMRRRDDHVNDDVASLRNDEL